MGGADAAEESTPAWLGETSDWMASVTAGGGGREIASVCGAGATGGRGTEGAELGTDGPAVKERLGCQSGKAVHDSSTSNDNPRIVAPNVRAETLPKRADAPMRCCVDPGACAANNAPESCPALLARRPGPIGGSVKPILLAQPRQYWAVSLLMVWHVPQMSVILTILGPSSRSAC